MIELVPENCVAALDPEKIFQRPASLHVDLGCGDGSFLCELAQKFPEKNFLGVERLSGRVASACRKSHKIDNLRILNMETSYAVRYLLPPESVETFYLLFPDPWPKRRHHRRRIFTPEFLDSIHGALEHDGILHVATDRLDYFQQIERVGRVASGFDIAGANEFEFPLTKFEKRFRAQDAPIYRLALGKVSPVI